MIGSRFGQRMRIMLVASLAAFAVLAVGATGAQAKWVTLSGSTEVTPSSQALQFLNDKGVSVAPVAPATFGGGAFTLPIRAGFGNTKNYQGILVHKGGLQFSRGQRSFVVRGFVVVRTKPSGAVLLAKIPALRGGCANIRNAVRRFLVNHPVYRNKVRRLVKRYPKAARKVLQAARNYCDDGRVIVLARLKNLGKAVSGNTATLTADLRLSKQAAGIINRRFGTSLRAGALLGTGESTVTVGK